MTCMRNVSERQSCIEFICLDFEHRGTRFVSLPILSTGRKLQENSCKELLQTTGFVVLACTPDMQMLY